MAEVPTTGRHGPRQTGLARRGRPDGAPGNSPARRRLPLVAVLALIAAVAAPSGFPSSAAAPGVGVLPPGGLWALSFADEFDGTALDGGRWHTCHWWSTTTCSIESNSELELYTPANVSVANGSLRLQARREQAVGWNGKTFDYTSGMVSSGGRKYEIDPGFVFTYGYAEARVKVPRGQGLWPAMWLLPASYESVPEIDVMEILGQDPSVHHMNFHYVDASGDDARFSGEWAGPDFAAGWHTFAIDWAPGRLVWYVDGVERARFESPKVSSEPSYLLFNLAVGGDWPGPPDSSTAFPADYLVDWVRVWRQVLPSVPGLPGLPVATSPAPTTSPPPTTSSPTTAPPTSPPTTGPPTTGPPTTTSPPTTVTTRPPAPGADLTSPRVNVRWPLDGTAVGTSTTAVAATATDNVAVTRMEIHIDGVRVASANGSSIAHAWDTSSAAPGSHVVEARAFDAAGNVGLASATVTR